MDLIFMELKAFFLANSAPIIWILAIIFGGRLALELIANKIIKRADNGDDSVETGKEKRAKTLANLLVATGKVVIFIIALISFLQILGIDPIPVLAGASVLGFAVGFGAQTLIKDFLAGIFIFVENQFAVGDRVKIGAVEGTVHKMSMRTTVIIDAEGNFVFIPNGSITSVINRSLGEHAKSIS